VGLFLLIQPGGGNALPDAALLDEALSQAPDLLIE
jgi:hypothetical protein